MRPVYDFAQKTLLFLIGAGFLFLPMQKVTSFFNSLNIPLEKFQGRLLLGAVLAYFGLAGSRKLFFRKRKENATVGKIIFRKELEKPISEVPQYFWIAPKLEVMVFRQEETLAVFPSICPHMGAQMELQDNKVTCPWHGLSYCSQKKLSDHSRYRTIDSFPAEILNNEIIIYEKNKF